MAKVISAKDETIRLFKSDFMEFFTHVSWWIPLVLYVPLLPYFIWKSLPHFHLASFLLWILAGFAFWTFTEYSMHRFLFHFHPKSPKLKRVFYTLHEIHHDYPSDSTRLVMPPILSIPLAFLFYFIFSSVFAPGAFEPFYIGFGIGYLSYDMTHYALHHLSFKSSWWKFLKKYHLQHHFQEQDRAFGVFSPLWDYVFGTYARQLGTGKK